MFLQPLAEQVSKLWNCEQNPNFPLISPTRPTVLELTGVCGRVVRPLSDKKRPHQIVSRLTTFCPQSHSYVVVFLQPALYLLHLDCEVVSGDAMCKGELFHLRRGCRGDTVSCFSKTARA